MSDDTKEWDGIAKYRYTDDETGKAIFDATDEIHDELRELIEKFRYERELPAGQANKIDVAQAYEECADELERVLEGDSNESI